MSDGSSNDKKGKGFAGLDSMVSDVTEDVERAATQSSPPQSPPQPPSKPSAAPADGSQPSGSGKTGIGGVGWLIAGVVGLVIWIFNSGDKSSPPAPYDAPPSYSSPAPPPVAAPIPAPVATLPATASTPGMEKPPVSRNKVLNVRQIRYCMTEKLRIEAFESLINAANDHEVDRFNALVNDYKTRCGEFRYRQVDFERVQRELDPVRELITSSARSEWVRRSLGLQSPSQAPAAKAAQAPQKAKPRQVSSCQSDGDCPAHSHPATSISMDSLSNTEKDSIESSCGYEKRVNGPAAYNQCVSRELSALKRGPRNVDLSSLSNTEKDSIESSCDYEKRVDGPAAYNSCLTTKLRQLR